MKKMRLAAALVLLVSAFVATQPGTAGAGPDGTFVSVQVENDWVDVGGFGGPATVSFSRDGEQSCDDWVTSDGGNPQGCNIKKGDVVSATNGDITATVIAEGLKVLKTDALKNVVVVKINTPNAYTFGCDGAATVAVGDAIRYVPGKGAKHTFDFDEPGPCPGPEDDATVDLIACSSAVEEGECDEVHLSLFDDDGDRTFLPIGVEAGKPKPPRKLRVQANTVTNKKFKVRYNPPGNDGGAPIVHYEVRYRVKGNTDWQYAQSEAPTTEVVLKQLVADTVYQIHVRAMNEHEKWSNWSERITQRTDP